jgi:hypothetical protein
MSMLASTPSYRMRLLLVRLMVEPSRGMPSAMVLPFRARCSQTGTRNSLCGVCGAQPRPLPGVRGGI